MLRRIRFKKLPIQANYYPIPTIAYLEDSKYRISLITGSPLGVSSLKPGQLEIMLDRRLYQDDNLGMGQGVLDNHPTRHLFRVLLEQRENGCKVINFYQRLIVFNRNHGVLFRRLAIRIRLVFQRYRRTLLLKRY